jgi:L-asparagine oxygenase
VIIRPLRRADGHWVLVYDELLMSALTERSRAALTRLHEAVRQATRHIVLHTGDLLRLDNSRIVHGRTPFRPRYDGTDRWLKRALVVRSLPVYACSGRVIRTLL